jgi:hypothetical protein
MSKENENNSFEESKEKKIREVGELFSGGFNIYKENWRSFFKILLIFILGTIPVWVVAGVKLAIGENIDSVGIYNFFFVLLGLVAGIFTIYINISAKATAFMYFKRLKEKSKNIKNLFHECRKQYFGPLLLVNILVFIFVLLWSLLLIIPGIIFGIYYSFAGWVVIFEERKGKDALNRSKELVKGNWWGVFARYIFLYLALFLFLIVLDVVLTPLGAETAEAIGNLVEQIVSFLLMPFFFAYSYLIYKDLVRIKGGNLKQQYGK